MNQGCHGVIAPQLAQLTSSTLPADHHGSSKVLLGQGLRQIFGGLRLPRARRTGGRTAQVQASRDVGAIVP